ncbi:LOW QUALITY PROTEIN: protein suppressor of white apricot [Musca domestica]|uniref:LOW QUALITY PROTEIN: protein suppressor of white apricot n=1 Tax=Musca domestica TaxID=7370 RepID=A0A9J7CLT2_MUSDO|nr:LOW QUALITY PROTEIN: protein suppressor of white apricot [Musca domestica]
MEKKIDLLVFGYACKIFRDDDKAREIDQGKHLIPWMGDDTLKIDRYDVRGALYDLTPYEPPPGGGYENRLDCLTAEEQRAEQLCEEERYMFLYKNEEDVVTNQEEELKRLKQETNGGGYSQVGHTYDEPKQSGPEFSNSPTCEEPEQIFQLPPSFYVPPDMHLPETMKQHAIIEKTARFIASQGVQMEILLKAKQSNNIQFEFLSQSSQLYPYYKHVISAIKAGTYPETFSKKDTGNCEDDSSFATSGDADVNAEEKPVVLVPMVKYKPSADCAYTQLISKIKGVPLEELHDDSSRQSATSQQEATNVSPCITPVLLQYNGATFMTEQDDGSDSGSRKTSNIAADANLDDTVPKVEILKNSSALALAQNYSSDSESNGEDESSSTPSFNKEKTPPNLEFPVPTENLRNIIDKTAVYVIKNGRQFEETLRSKSAERFTFLLPDNEYYPYYMYKITGDVNAASKERKQRKAKEVAEALMNKKGLTRDKVTNHPVCFSIKAKEESSNATLQPPVLPQDTSDDEEKQVSPSPAATNIVTNRAATTTATTNNPNRHVPEHVQKAIFEVESQLMARNAQIAAAALAFRTSSILPVNNLLPMPTIPATHQPKPALLSGPAVLSSNLSAATKAEAERNAIFEQQQQQRHKELKKAEEKVKDKLAQIAREKLGGLVSKEKQLQLERKRKAMAFLNQIKAVASGEISNQEQITKTDETNDEPYREEGASDSEDSVQSIPITSYGPEDNSEEENPVNIETEKVIPQFVPVRVTPSTKLTKQLDDRLPITGNTNVIGKRKSRSRSRPKERVPSSTPVSDNKRQYRKQESRSTSSSSETSNAGVEDNKKRKHRSESRSKSKSHKSKKSKTKKSKSKKKSKKSQKSKSRTRSRSRSRSHNRHSDRRHHHRHQRDRSRSRTYSDNYSSDSSDCYQADRSHRDKRTTLWLIRTMSCVQIAMQCSDMVLLRV